MATAVGRTTELTDEMLHSVESGQRAAIEAVHKFVDRVDHTLAGDGAKATRRQEILDAALEMSDRLVHTEYDFLRRVVDGAAESLTPKKAGRK